MEKKVHTKKRETIQNKDSNAQQKTTKQKNASNQKLSEQESSSQDQLSDDEDHQKTLKDKNLSIITISNKKDSSSIKKSTIIKNRKQKVYHLVNPNIQQDLLQNMEQKCFHTKQITLKSTIIFLVLILLIMIGIYKIIQEIYQIQHPQLFKSSQRNQKLINTVTKENKLNNQKISQQNIQKVTDQKDNNKIQKVQRRYRQNVQNIKQSQNLQQPNTKESLPNIAQFSDHKIITMHETAQDQINNQKKKRQQYDQILKKRQQVIDNYQKQEQQKWQALEQKRLKRNKIQQLRHPEQQMPATRLSTQKQGPTPKANITSQQAVRWKGFQEMTSLPSGVSIQTQSMLAQQYWHYQSRYNISRYKELPICVVVPSFNNAQNQRYQENLKSILQQNYTNYHVVFIDDKSDDRTGQLVKEYLQTLDQEYQQKVKVIINAQRKMAMPNLRYAALNQCQQNQLFMIVDGDDGLIGRQVFKLFSAVMQQRNYWVMWTNFLSPKGTIGYSRSYSGIHRKSNNYRKAGFVMSHLRAYYTKLFRLIKQEDLKDQKGEFFHAANDVAICIPILQMAHQHTGYVPQLTYFYNLNTGLNNHKLRLKQQKANDRKIRKKTKYQALQKLQFSQIRTEQQLNQISNAQSLKNNQLTAEELKNLKKQQLEKPLQEIEDNKLTEKAIQDDLEAKEQFHKEEMEQNQPNDEQKIQKQNMEDQNQQNPKIQKNNQKAMSQDERMQAMIMQQLALHNLVPVSKI